MEMDCKTKSHEIDNNFYGRREKLMIILITYAMRISKKIIVLDNKIYY